MLNHVAPLESLAAAPHAVDEWVAAYDHHRPYDAFDDCKANPVKALSNAMKGFADTLLTEQRRTHDAAIGLINIDEQRRKEETEPGTLAHDALPYPGRGIDWDDATQWIPNQTAGAPAPGPGTYALALGHSGRRELQEAARRVHDETLYASAEEALAAWRRLDGLERYLIRLWPYQNVS